MAKIAAAELYADATRAAMGMHGGYAYIDEHPLTMHYADSVIATLPGSVRQFAVSISNDPEVSPSPAVVPLPLPVSSSSSRPLPQAASTSAKTAASVTSWKRFPRRSRMHVPFVRTPAAWAAVVVDG